MEFSISCAEVCDQAVSRTAKYHGVTLAIVGAPKSGKSTFIQYALDLKTPPHSRVSIKKVSLEGVVSVLKLHEVDIRDVKISPEGVTQWPYLPNHPSRLRIDGALLLYSITNLASTKRIAPILSEYEHFVARGSVDLSHNY